MSDDYLCLTVLSRPGEDAGAFKERLSQFWTHMLRQHPDEFERVYAETVQFETKANRLSRQYLIEMVVADLLERELSTAGLDHEPLDRDDRYSKFEATPPDWMWIEH